jgi:muramoyltetrapeptide carboxypeptidase LdcA involved in peptidoglycan recycling
VFPVGRTSDFLLQRAIYADLPSNSEVGGVTIPENDTAITLKRPQSGQLAAIIAPSSSGWRLSSSTEVRAARVLRDLGLQATPSRHMRSRGKLETLDWSLRLMDIRDALSDPTVGLILPVYGGFNSIDLLPHLPYNLWLQSRKPLIGYTSDHERRALLLLEK